MSTTNTLSTSNKVLPYVASGAYPFAVVSNAWQPASVVYGAGTGAGLIDQIYQAQVTATVGGASIQLNAGSLLDTVGDTLSFARADSINFYNAGTQSVTVTGAFITANYGTAGVKLDAGGGQFSHTLGTNSTSGLATGTGTNSTLTFTASGTAGTSPVQILVAGRSV